MNQKEWHAKLEEWAFDDARLCRMPLALLPTLAEHLANWQAAEQSVQATGLCPFCGEPIAAAGLHEFCYPPEPPHA